MGVIARWRDRLPVGPATPDLTLGEGDTPLVHAPRLSERTGLDVWLKCEGLNPTGSFKDRGMAVAVAKAVEAGATGIVCASTGNTAASAAAYAARAGIEAVVVHPAGAVADAKLAQARAVGARIVAVAGSFGDALDEAIRLAEEHGYSFVNSLNPYRREGQKTAAFEIVEQLGRVPDALALPYGGGGNVRAYAQGFDELGVRPRLVLGEAAERASTRASAIRISQPAHAPEVDALEPLVVTLGDDEILDAWRELATGEGVFCEPASAAGYAAARRADLDGATVVCVVTGHGLKDPAAVAVEAVAGAAAR
jgi:threonine synthase